MTDRRTFLQQVAALGTMALLPYTPEPSQALTYSEPPRYGPSPIQSLIRHPFMRYANLPPIKLWAGSWLKYEVDMRDESTFQGQVIPVIHSISYKARFAIAPEPARKLAAYSQGMFMRDGSGAHWDQDAYPLRVGHFLSERQDDELGNWRVTEVKVMDELDRLSENRSLPAGMGELPEGICEVKMTLITSIQNGGQVDE